jgi:hypothetical protein
MTDNRTVGARKPLMFRLGAVHWYLRHALSDGDVADLRRERGISVAHTTVFRWVQRSAPERDRSGLCCVSGRYPPDRAIAVPDPYPPPRVSRRGTYLVGFMRCGEEGPGRSGRELGRHGLDAGITHPHFWGSGWDCPCCRQSAAVGRSLRAGEPCPLYGDRKSAMIGPPRLAILCHF